MMRRRSRCCFCFDIFLGVKVLACIHMLIEVVHIVMATLVLPQFLFAIAPTSSIGIFCDVFLLIAAFKGARWFSLPWLIYIMVLIVGFGLGAVLRVVIALGAVHNQDWLEVCLTSAALLVVGAIYLYFWIVVLEFFIQLGPPMVPMPPPPPPPTVYETSTGLIYGNPYVSPPQHNQQPTSGYFGYPSADMMYHSQPPPSLISQPPLSIG